MTYATFLRLYEEAQASNDLSYYIAERGWQDWMDDYGDAD